MEEEKKYETIKRLVEEGGNKDRAAMTLGITRRQVNRLIRRYQEAGKGPPVALRFWWLRTSVLFAVLSEASRRIPFDAAYAAWGSFASLRMTVGGLGMTVCTLGDRTHLG